jgi:hypothetical protein
VLLLLSLSLITENDFKSLLSLSLSLSLSGLWRRETSNNRLTIFSEE